MLPPEVTVSFAVDAFEAGAQPVWWKPAHYMPAVQPLFWLDRRSKYGIYPLRPTPGNSLYPAALRKVPPPVRALAHRRPQGGKHATPPRADAYPTTQNPYRSTLRERGRH